MLRFASSPNRDMNLSDLRVAIFNYIYSKQLNEDLVVRIDDTDKNTNIEGKDKEILEILNLFAIEYKNGLHQSDSLKYHQKLAMQLMAQKKAFSCFCGEPKLEELKQKAIEAGKTPSYDGFCQTLSDETVLNTNAPFTVRIAKPQENISFTDLLQGDFSYTSDEIDAFNILTHDKTPTYNYASAIDDMLMNISTVVRLDKYLLDTARQIHIRKLFGYENELKYVHIPSIQNDTSVKSLIDEGFLPSAIANYLVLTTDNTPSEIFTLEDAINWFKIENISKDSVNFDIVKLKEINKKHLEMLDDMRLSKILGFADSDIGKLAKLYLNEANTIDELKENINAIFVDKTLSNEFKDELEKIKECLKSAPYIDSFEDLKKYIIEKTNLSNETLEKPLRVLLTNKNDGPELASIYPLIKNYLGEIIK